MKSITTQIETNKQLEFNYVAAYRFKTIESEIQSKLDVFIHELKETGTNPVFSMISTTHAIESIDNNVVLDMEFLFPIDREIKLSKKYRFIKNWKLINALYVRHTGSQEELLNTYEEINNYIVKNGYLQITSGYNVNEINSETSLPVIDIYVGLSPNLL